jgi:hypothetical protein
MNGHLITGESTALPHELGPTPECDKRKPRMRLHQDRQEQPRIVHVRIDLVSGGIFCFFLWFRLSVLLHVDNRPGVPRLQSKLELHFANYKFSYTARERFIHPTNPR